MCLKVLEQNQHRDVIIKEGEVKINYLLIFHIHQIGLKIRLVLLWKEKEKTMN
jgi:hypothetical protein